MWGANKFTEWKMFSFFMKKCGFLTKLCIVTIYNETTHELLRQCVNFLYRENHFLRVKTAEKHLETPPQKKKTKKNPPQKTQKKPKKKKLLNIEQVE